MNVTPDFGHYLAGLIDGEGCFSIHPNGKTGWVTPFFLSLRADDRAILEEIQHRTGIGKLYHRRPQSERHGGQITWNVDRKADTLQLVRLLERYPLRAKKARDFAVWREAVLYRNGFCGQGRGVPTAALAEMAVRLRETRAFESAGEMMPLGEPSPGLFDPTVFARCE